MTDTLSKLKALIATANGAVYKTDSEDPDTRLAALLCNNAKALIGILEDLQSVLSEEGMRELFLSYVRGADLLDKLATLESANETKD